MYHAAEHQRQQVVFPEDKPIRSNNEPDRTESKRHPSTIPTQKQNITKTGRVRGDQEMRFIRPELYRFGACLSHMYHTACVAIQICSRTLCVDEVRYAGRAKAWQVCVAVRSRKLRTIPRVAITGFMYSRPILTAAATYQ